MEEYDDEEFERLCAQELELMNEVADHLNQGVSSVNQVDEIDTNDIPFTEEPTTIQKSISTLDGNTDISEFKEYTFDDELKDPTTVKKRLLDDITSGEESGSTFKRRRSYLPVVGYEINQISKIDPDLEIIERIISHRKKLETAREPLSTAANEWSLPLSETKKKFKLHSRIPKGDFQSITSGSGKRFYLDVSDESDFDLSLANAGEATGKRRLLSVPYYDLRIEAEKELLSLNSQILSEEEGNGISRDCSESEGTDGDLWATRYKPRNYLDLLSDEATNRTVLQWMKLWDKMVFGYNAKSRKKDKMVKGRAKFVSKFAPEVVEEFDEMGRPQQKAVLLCGPPGLGKTTLAHIIATHAGYNAVEMNASDDRGVDSFRTNLENATSMKSVFGTEKRPNCLIIDEIDGAPAASINLLVSLLQAKAPKNEAAKGKKKDKLVLHRPLICICNDLYNISLRPLRQISLVIQFPPTQSLRLAQRLLFISQKQHMKADLSVLLALCKKTENDIRSCLSVLQFVRITTGELKLMDLQGVSVGQKDYQRSLFTVWHDIFTLPRPQREFRENPHQQPLESKALREEMTPKELSNPTLSQMSRFSEVLKVAQSCGEYEKLTLGWFENYPHLKFKHIHLEPVTAGLEWATTTDLLQKEIAHHQNWSLAAYIPLSFVAYHFLFASNTRPKLQFPNQYQEVSSKLIKTKGLIDVMVEGMSAYTRLFSSKITLVQDIIPYMMYILQPSLRPVNVQLFSKKEREELKQLVNTMISYNLTYQQERTPEGTYVFTLDPNVEDVAQFPTLPKPRLIPYSSKQLIAREVELEKVRIAEKYFSSQPENSSVKTAFTQKATDAKSKKTQESSIAKGNSEKKPVPNHLQKFEVKKRDKTPLPKIAAKDFFGRVIAPSEKQQKNLQDDLLKSDVWFKFKEGYSNAVRRTIKVKDFFS